MTAAVTLRNELTRPLTWNETDANWVSLVNAIAATATSLSNLTAALAASTGAAGIGAVNAGGNTNVQAALNAIVAQMGASLFVLNVAGADVTSTLRLNRSTGGASDLDWDGSMMTTSKPFTPAQLGINEISASVPTATFPGMVWLFPL